MNNHFHNQYRKLLLNSARLINDTPSTGPGTTPGSSASKPAKRPPAAPTGTPSGAPKKAVGDKARDARAKAGEAPAKGLTKKPDYPEYIDKIKDPKYKAYAKAAIDIGKKYGMSANDQTIKLFVGIAILFSRVTGMLDRLPGGYRKSLDKGEYEDERLTASQKAKMLERLRMDQLEHGNFLTTLKNIDKERKTKLTPSQRSTLFVSYMLFGGPKPTEKPGKDQVIEHKILAARLHHSSTEYSGTTLKTLREQANIPRGTVIFFTYGPSKAIYTAISTGDKQNFLFYDSGNKPQTLDLADDKAVGTYLMAAFVPKQYSLSQKPTGKPVKSGAKTPTKPGSKPAAKKETLPKGVNPESLILYATNEVIRLEKLFKAAKVKEKTILQVLRNFPKIKTLVIKMEDVEKIKRLKPQMYAKVKAKYEKLVPRVAALIELIDKKLKEAKKIALQEASLRKQLAAAKTAKKAKLIAELEIKIKLIELMKVSKATVDQVIAQLKKWVVRVKACLPKRAGT